jgi:hypothetical protein
MSATHEIKTVEEFRRVADQADGVVVITDTPTSVINANKPTYRYVTEDNFTTKVINGRNATGRYFLFLRYDDAARETGAAWCGSCGVP